MLIPTSSFSAIPAQLTRNLDRFLEKSTDHPSTRQNLEEIERLVSEASRVANNKEFADYDQVVRRLGEMGVSCQAESW
jgi:hypothetical protein